MTEEPQQELMTLAVENGIEHILDLNTGRQLRAMPAALRQMRRLAERSVNKDKIQAVLKAAGIFTFRDAEDDLVARLFDEDINIIVMDDCELVRFLRFRALKPFVPEDALNSALRLVSLNFDVARFRSANDGLVCADYSMSYEHGISPQQMVGMLRGFAWTVKQAFESEELSELLGG